MPTTMSGLIAVVLVLLVVIGAGATLKVEKRCETTTQLNSASDSLFRRDLPDRSHTTCSWSIVWRY
jgi:hypothetical protein